MYKNTNFNRERLTLKSLNQQEVSASKDMQNTRLFNVPVLKGLISFTNFISSFQVITCMGTDRNLGFRQRLTRSL